MSKIIGVDEVGRGSVAGPLVACAVLIDDGAIEGVKDSKLVAEERRCQLGDLIRRRAQFCVIAERGVTTINATSVQACWRDVMVEVATAAHEKHPDATIIIDGSKDEKLAKRIPFVKFQINGDDDVYQIAAASLVAKAYTDRLWQQLDAKYPVYGFKNSKGYPTPEHLKAIKEFGICDIHRAKQVHKAMHERPGKIMDPSEQVSDISPVEAADYIRKTKESGVELSDWESNFLNDLARKLALGLDPTPRQKWFIKNVYDRVEKKAKKRSQKC